MSKQVGVRDLKPIPKTKKQRRALLADDNPPKDGVIVWKVVTFVPRQQVHDVKGEKMRLCMFKIRQPNYASKADADEAVQTYWSVREPLLPHMVNKVGSWDAFLDEDDRQMMMVNKDSYKTSDPVMQQVMKGYFDQIEEGRTDIEFRYDDRLSETKLWKKMNKWEHSVPENTDDEIRDPKKHTTRLRTESKPRVQSRHEAKKYENNAASLDRKTMSDHRARNHIQGDTYDADDDAMLSILDSLNKHRKNVISNLKRRQKRS